MIRRSRGRAINAARKLLVFVSGDLVHGRLAVGLQALQRFLTRAQRAGFRADLETVVQSLPNVPLVPADGSLRRGDHPVDQGQMIAMADQRICLDLHLVNPNRAPSDQRATALAAHSGSPW